MMERLKNLANVTVTCLCFEMNIIQCFNFTQTEGIQTRIITLWKTIHDWMTMAIKEYHFIWRFFHVLNGTIFLSCLSDLNSMLGSDLSIQRDLRLPRLTKIRLVTEFVMTQKLSLPKSTTISSFLKSRLKWRVI